MLTIFNHLSEKQLIELTQLVQKIAKAINPEKIICYGSRTTFMQDWSCFLEGSGHRERIETTYDLLIISNADEKRKDREIIQTIEQEADRLGCGVTGIVKNLPFILEHLRKGSRFISTLHRKGVLLYNSSGLPLPAPPEEQDVAALKNKAEAYWNQCFSIAQRFFKTATFCLNNGWHERTIFDLHQSVQHTCMALLRVYTGYRPTTHNLAQLLVLIENFSFMPATIFPCITKEETDLFNLLNRSYSDARYNEQYVVPAEKAILLVHRVKEFLTIAEELYNEKMDTLKNSKQISFPLNITDSQN